MDASGGPRRPVMIEEVMSAARTERLDVFGLLHAEPDDGIGEGTIVLLGPAEPGFWPHVTATPEFGDGEPDPLDRWSARVIKRIAANTGGQALLPFGKPARPFTRWALRSGHAFVSPVLLLVHARAGLFVSYRGAILLPELLELPKTPSNPCDTCKGRPCLAACPASALVSGSYDIPACHAYLDTDAGQTCMTLGCAVRRSCPLGRNYPRMETQSAHHMKAFHP